MLVFTWRSMELEVAGQGPVGEHVLVQLHDLAQVSAGQVLHALSPWLYQHSRGMSTLRETWHTHIYSWASARHCSGSLSEHGGIAFGWTPYAADQVRPACCCSSPTPSDRTADSAASLSSVAERAAAGDGSAPWQGSECTQPVHAQ